MIDCSNFDFLQKKSYQSNIEACLAYLESRFGRNSLIIQKFFLTHPHYDHYSGISKLLDRRLLDSNTEFFLNLHYSMPNENYNRLLKKINALKPKIVEPIAAINTPIIKIFHPHKRVVRSMTAKYYGQTEISVIPSPNNASIALQFSFSGKSIIFTGDLETDGWNSVRACYQVLPNSDYYVISHHGSRNGHLRNICPCSSRIHCVKDCLSKQSVPILMGRHGAYNGIYSDNVLNDFSNILFSEKDHLSFPAKFLEIDWKSNVTKWY